MRILFIEDDVATARSIELMLESAAFSFDAARTGEEGLDLGKLYDYDLILLDLQLPDMSGFDILRALRLARVRTPVLVLSGNVIVDAKVKALRLGADDYLTKPFHKGELIARIQAVVRRSTGHAHSIVTVGKLCIDLDSKIVSVAGSQVPVTGREYQILELLCLRKGALVTKESFINHLYGGLDEPESKVLEVFICKLRKKLAAACDGEHYIETIWDQGFKLSEPAYKAAA